MSDFDAATDELVRLAKTMGTAGEGMQDVAQHCGALNLPNTAFGTLGKSDEVAASYLALKEQLTRASNEGAQLLTGIGGGLGRVAKHYSDQDASVESVFNGG